MNFQKAIHEKRELRVPMKFSRASLLAQMVKTACNEDALENGMATHSSILALKIPWTEEPGGLQPMG